jgi:alginate O-acetyltransferase complex protein AlgJ
MLEADGLVDDAKSENLSFDLRARLRSMTGPRAAVRSLAFPWRGIFQRASRHAAVVEPDTRQMLRDMVLEGKDGYLFHRDHEAIEQITGDLTFSPAELGQWLATLETRKAWCDAHGIVSRFLIVPEKHVVYADKLPSVVRVSPQRPAARLTSAASEFLDGNILYPLESLQRARTERETYYRTDTHWSAYGAFVTYKELVASLSRDIVLPGLSDAEVSWSRRRYIGDLGVRFEPELGETIEFYGQPLGAHCRVPLQNNKFERGNVQVFVNDRTHLPRAVLFRDSFAQQLISPLLESVSRLVVVGSLSMHYDLLRAERPDLVVVQVAERFLGTFWTGQEILMPKDLAQPTFVEFTGVAIDAIRAS